MTVLPMKASETANFAYSNVQAEQALLGTILVNNDAFFQVPKYFRPEHFSEPLHQRIYQAIRGLTAEGKVANPLTLKQQFDGDPALSDIGGARYLKNLALNAVTIIHIPDYCETIHQAWMRTELAKLCGEALSVLSGEKQSSDIGADLSARISEILGDAVSSKAVTDYDIGLRILDDLKNDVKPFSSGLSKLNEAMGGGLFPGKLYGFAARKKVGKTTLAATLSNNLAQQGIKHLFICCEMSAKEVQQRVLARMTDSYDSAFRNEYGKSMAFQQNLAHAITQSKKCVFYEDKPGITFQELQQLIPVFVLRHKIRGFILDYWQLVGGKPKQKSTAEHLDEVAQWLATACRKYGIFGIVMAQINQDGNTRGSEGLRLAADQVYEIHRDDVTLPTAWLEMMETRYTRWANIGSKDWAGLMMNEKGPYFEQA